MEQKRLRQETDDFKEEFRKVHGRDPAIGDVYNLHMDRYHTSDMEEGMLFYEKWYPSGHDQASICEVGET